MVDFCIPKHLIKNLSDAINEKSIMEIFDMSKNERVAFFEKNSNHELAIKISGQFDNFLNESKRNAIEKALKMVGLKDKELVKSILKDIRSLKNNELLDPSKEEEIMTKITEAATGSNLTPEEITKLTTLGDKLEQHKIALESTPMLKDGRINSDYHTNAVSAAEAQYKIDEFIYEHIPKSMAETFWSHAKASMLYKVSSAIVNIISNTVNSGLHASARRAGTLKMGGSNGDLSNDWKKLMAEIYSKTGYDYTRAYSLDDMITGHGKALGEITGVGNETAFTNFIYKTVLGSPDAWAARMNFADTANIYSDIYAKKMGLTGDEAKKKAGEIMSDAFQVAPLTPEGKMVRELAVGEAMSATFTNNSKLSKLTMGIKNALNKATPTVRIGDLAAPFVKTPTNVIGQGLDNAGLGGLKATAKFIKAYKINSTQPEEAQKLLFEAANIAAKTGISLTAAAALAYSIPADNFIGAYDPRRSQWEQLKNTNYNALKIPGTNKWISLDYLGPIGTPLVSMLYAKKYGGSISDKAANYAAGMFSQLMTIPFAQTGYDAYVNYSKNFVPGDTNFAKFAADFSVSQIASRIPGFMTDISHMSDSDIRDTTSNKNTILGVSFDSIVAKIPWVAETGLDMGLFSIKPLPTKRTILGEVINTEQGNKENNYMMGLVSNIVAAGRVKTEQISPEGEIIYNLYKSGNPPAVTNWKFSQSDKLKRLKEKVGEEKYQEIFIKEYGPKFKSEISTLSKNDAFIRAKDEDKKKQIDKKEDDVMNRIYMEYQIFNKTK